MTNKRVIDFDKDFSIVQQELSEVSKGLKTIKSLNKQNSIDLTLLEGEILKLVKSKQIKFLRFLGVDQDGKLNGFLSSLEKTCKVNFETSTSRNFGIYSREVSGFYPKTHRLMNLGHDPFF